VRTHPQLNTHPSVQFPFTEPSPRRNTQIEDTCIVFRSWHISSRFIFALSFVAIIFISVGYEYLRAYQRNVDRRIALALCRGKGRDKSAVSGRTSPELSGEDVENAGLLSGCPKKLSALYVLMSPTRSAHNHNEPFLFSTPVPFYPRAFRATLYGAQVFVSFFLMLVFMTYNVGLAVSLRMSADLLHRLILFLPWC